MALHPRLPARFDSPGCCYALGSGAQRFCDTRGPLRTACCTRLSRHWWTLAYRLVVAELRQTTFATTEGLQRLVGPGQRRGTGRRLVCAGEPLDDGYNDDRECQDSNGPGE